MMMMNCSQCDDSFELGRLARAQCAAFNDPHYEHQGVDGMDINLDVLYLENYKPWDFDPLPFKEKEIDLAVELEGVYEEDALEIEDDFCLFGVDSTPSYKRLKSFSIPISLDVKKRKKEFKKLIGKLSRERRHSENTRNKQERRKSNPFSNVQFYINGDMDLLNYEQTSPNCVSVIL